MDDEERKRRLKNTNAAITAAKNILTQRYPQEYKAFYQKVKRERPFITTTNMASRARTLLAQAHREEYKALYKEMKFE